MDSALNVTVAPGANTNWILGANADLFTAKAGTFSPNAAFAQATYLMTAGHTYVFKLKWKMNKPASGATIYAAAGGPAPFFPTRLTVELTNQLDPNESGSQGMGSNDERPACGEGLSGDVATRG